MSAHNFSLGSGFVHLWSTVVGPNSEPQLACEYAPMAPLPVWSGNLRLSLVLVPVKLFPAVADEERVAFRMIHRESGQPIKYQKGIETDHGFKEVPEEEIIKGYEYAKGEHVLIKPEEIDELKLEAKHTIDMARFVDEDEIDARYWEKPYYLLPDGDSGDEGYVVLREALRSSGKVAIGQLVMQGREHLVGIKALGRGLMLVILRYANELRDEQPYFDNLTAEPESYAVKLAAGLIERETGKFEPKKMPNEYAKAVHELVRAKVEQRTPEVAVAEERASAPVINIMDALKKSMQAKRQANVRDAVRQQMGKDAPQPKAVRAKSGAKARPSRAAH
jgi:DNA end-binding protein Ku